MIKIFVRFLTLLSLVALTSSCATNKLPVALQAYHNGEYHEASQILKKIYKKTDAKTEKDIKAEVAWYLGNCYDRLMIWSQASLYYQNAQRFGYQDSLLTYKIADCKSKTRKMSQSLSSRYVIKKLSIVNSRRADFSPAVYDDNELYYTTSNDKVTGKDISTITGTKNSDIWVVKKDEKGAWQKPQPAGENINTIGDEGTPCFSPDGKTMYYTAAGTQEGTFSSPAIFFSRRSDATWSKGERLHITNDTIATYAHPAISPDGQYLYFVSNIVGGEGGNDIWRAKLSQGSVLYIENLGSKVNTSADEMFPTVSPDGTLYFSSNRDGGIGALDIYSAREVESGQWEVTHLDSPINSPADDFGMTFLKNTQAQQEGFFCSNRNSAKGYDDIYSFVLPSIIVRITGMVYDNDSNPLAEAIVRIVGRNGLNYKTLSRPDGSFEINIDRSTEYVMMSGKKGYLNRKAEFRSEPDEEDADYMVDFYLPSVSEPVLIENVFYDYNKATLQESSYVALDQLVQLLNDNPYTQIELSAHTDRIGSHSFNLELSRKRAQSVCEYLISKGIDPNRLVPVGYGKTQPKISEEEIEAMDEAEQQKADQTNRRTEFKVLTTTLGIK